MYGTELRSCRPMHCQIYHPLLHDTIEFIHVFIKFRWIHQKFYFLKVFFWDFCQVDCTPADVFFGGHSYFSRLFHFLEIPSCFLSPPFLFVSFLHNSLTLVPCKSVLYPSRFINFHPLLHYIDSANETPLFELDLKILTIFRLEVADYRRKDELINLLCGLLDNACSTFAQAEHPYPNQFEVNR